MKRRNFSPEFKRESAQQVVDKNYTVSDAAKAKAKAKAMDVGLSTMTKWVKQLHDERQRKRQNSGFGKIYDRYNFARVINGWNGSVYSKIALVRKR